ncbi:hypothetical protein BKP57_08230 [Virgibacillus sp. 6R]|uniref:Uncharacterized protein n=2 Tax=Virgibacillus pantothenticus TaxID=1473 RepID=A0A0L0QS98_VIRPA|nr:hypothetical protein BKP57_08230 [Virgibacillus sp. 6R]KNE21545.1 hypothetical protein AFK71_07785 [Virgibacillus pantothenticus]SIS73216.1 hypothetical protein SAMN05421787_102480 [Virgibacillus pantothenticus]
MYGSKTIAQQVRKRCVTVKVLFECLFYTKYKIFLVYSIRKTKASAIRLGDKPSFSNSNL